MIKKNKNLENIEPNKTVVFTTPIGDQKSVLVRTGSIYDENSILHAILTSYSKDYFYMDVKNRTKLLNKIKNNIFNKKQFYKTNIYFEDYRELLILTFQGLNNYIIDNTYIDCNKKIQKIIKNINKNELYDIIFELIAFDNLKNILSIKLEDELVNTDKNLFINYNKYFLDEIRVYFDSLEILKELNEARSVHIKKTLLNLVNEILNEVENIVYNSYFKNILKDPSIDTLKVLSKTLKIDFYFFDSETRLPYLIDKNFNNNTGIFILKLKDTYENIGLLSNNNKVKRIFNKDDLLFKKVKLFLLEPTKFKLKYPDLKKYALSDSENESESDTDINNKSSEEEMFDNDNLSKNSDDS